MTRPHPHLIDLVLGRGIPGLVETVIVRSALEHRVAGLLKTAIDLGAPASREAVTMLDESDIATWARNRVIAEAVAEIAGIAVDLGIDVAFMKGVTTEARWYDRLGERPTWDIDVVLAPWHRHRAHDLIEALQPTHSILPQLDSILNKDRLQSIDLGYKGLPIDLHLDPLKLELVTSRHPELLWNGIETVALERGPVPVFDPTVSLLLTALAVNKDRFRYLIGHSDLIRIERDPQIHFSRCEQLAKSEGVLIPFQSTLSAVRTDLGLPEGGAPSRNRAWDIFWAPSVRLLGDEGKVRFRYRQSLMPLFDGGRWPEVAASWWRRVLPSVALLDRLYPEIRGPYLARVFLARISRRLQRRRQRQALRSDG